ncbi:MAG: bifunctional phosphopantothenoylcysteine decarboxylase/phosphopantothenate--cysteine ligase CoaBC [Rhizobiaceae bacterium]
MASITIRNLDETAKQSLRERAARNGRSMEEEARLLLSGLSEFRDGTPVASAPLPDQRIALRDGALAGKRVLLVITGGIAAYKSLDLIRRLRERGVSLTCVMSRAATEFVTPLAVSALSGQQVHLDLFDRIAEHDVGHIRLARENDLIIVAPATADFMAKLANGLADDLASTVLLAHGGRVLLAPAMNPAMWSNPATQRNVSRLVADRMVLIGPGTGEMAESGEAGVGRMAEPLEIVSAAARLLDDRPRPLKGIRAIVTSGPTHEPIDPVRYIANRSSGKQGHAIAEALAAAGAEVILVSGPVSIPDPAGVTAVHVESARDMLAAVDAAMPADLAVMVAAVADWRTVTAAGQKMKKENGKGPAQLELTENPDILKTVGHHKSRPRLVIGFAAETHEVDVHARGKLERKNADWIVANDVSPQTGIMGGDNNSVRIISRDGVDVWPELAKQEVANRLVSRITDWFARNTART